MTDSYERPAEVGADDRQEAELLFFTSLVEFVTEYLAPLIRRRLNRSVACWCSSWWQHPEAVARLNSLWRAFEYLRRDEALGLSVWWIHHADPHLRALMDPDYGPFSGCDPREGHSEYTLDPLPLTEVPPGLLDHDGFTAGDSVLARRRAKHRPRPHDDEPTDRISTGEPRFGSERDYPGKV